MAQTVINVRVNEELKKQFEKFCNDTGMNISTAINIFISTVVREKQIPLKITIEPFYSEENMKHLRKAVDNVNNGKIEIHDTIEEE